MGRKNRKASRVVQWLKGQQRVRATTTEHGETGHNMSPLSNNSNAETMEIEGNEDAHLVESGRPIRAYKPSEKQAFLDGERELAQARKEERRRQKERRWQRETEELELDQAKMRTT